MEDLISEFTILSDEALRDKSFDPWTIEALMEQFELEAYNSWAEMEAECEKEAEEALKAMAEAEAEAEAELEAAMEEFRRFEEGMEAEAMAELSSLTRVGDASWRMRLAWEKAATTASNKYIDAAMKKADSSMKKSASKGIVNPSSKVHPR